MLLFHFMSVLIIYSDAGNIEVYLSTYDPLDMERRMKSTAFSMISEPRRLKNLGNSGSGFLLESSGFLSDFSSGVSSSFGLSSENKKINRKNSQV